MPIYEFVCQSCGNEFEQIRSFSDTSAPTCTVCQSEQVVRRLGRPAIHFKGSGWYITDSKKSSKESAVGASANGSEKKADASADATAGEVKSEAKAEGKADSKSGNTSDSKSTGKSEPVKAATE